MKPTFTEHPLRALMSPLRFGPKARDAKTFSASRLLSPRKGLVADRGGAAIPEFTMAIMPVLIIFFGMVQWSTIAYVHLVVKHAAFTAVRCEAVVHPGMPDSGEGCGEKAMDILFAHIHTGGNKAVVSFQNAPAAEQGMDSATVTLEYECKVPLGNKIACGKGRKMKLEETATFPNQGSAYQAVWGIGG